MRYSLLVCALGGLVWGCAPSRTCAQEFPDAAARPVVVATSDDRLPEDLFQKLDKNYDGVILDVEIGESDRARYGELLQRADRNQDRRITREEFALARQLPLHRDIRTGAALLLIVAFACFCLFLDGLLEPDRRDYFWHAIGGMIVPLGLAFLIAPGWFLEQSPYLGFVAVVPIGLVLLALVTGATRDKEGAAAQGPVVYKVGTKPSAAGPQAQRPGAPAPRKPAPPPRTPRPAPVPRPPLPERRPQPPTKSQPPKPGGQKPSAG
jgi:hypothetical protein